MTTDEHEMDTIRILRERNKEYRDLLSVAAGLVITAHKKGTYKTESVGVYRFLDELEKHGLVSKKESDET